MALVILVALAFFLLPDWLLPFLRGAISHINYNPSLTSIRIFASWWPVVGNRLGWLFSGFLILVLFFEWRNVRHKDFRHVLWTTSLTLAVTPFLGIPMIAQDEIVLFLPLILFLAILNERWSHPRRWGVSGIAILIVFFGFWLLTKGLSITGSSTTLNDVLLLLLPGLLVIGLYWMRWWAVYPPRTWRDMLP
jgi:hypothetical protein